MSKKRILICSLAYYPDFIGGAEVAIKEITDRLPEFEYDMITLRLSASLPKVEKVGNITVHRVGWVSKNQINPTHVPFWLNLNKYALPFLIFFKGFSLLRRNHFDVLWSMMATYNSFGAVLLKLLFPKLKFLLTLQEGDPIPYIKRRARFVWPWFTLIFKKSDCIQVISKYLGDFAKEMTQTSPVIVVPNGVDLEKFTSEVADSAKLTIAKKIHKKEGDIILVTTSRLVIKNAVEDCIDALSFLPSSVKFVIAGRGYLEESLKRKVKLLNLEARVVWLGHISHDEMVALFNVSDIFIRTPISEGFGNSYVEAMAAGLPCVATKVGGIVDFISDKETGVFAEVGNPQSIVDSVKLLIEDKELYKKIQSNALKMVREKYSWELISKEMKNIFLNL